jgi:hypothetical protein
MLATAAKLHPEMKYEYFKNELKDQPAWIKAPHTKIENLWQSFYRSSVPSDSAAPPASSLPSAPLHL